jgi:5'-nucleotidase
MPVPGYPPVRGPKNRGCGCRAPRQAPTPGGGDNFTVLRDGTNPVIGPVDLDALVEYVEGLPTPFTSQIEGRIVLTQ